MAGENRLFGYDLIRFVAMLFVVAVHSLMVVDDLDGVGAYYIWTGQAVFFTANALFFILSGRFNLRERTDDGALRRFYLGRFRNIILPISVIFVIRTAYDLYPSWPGFLAAFKALVINTIYGFNSMEYWFVYALVGFLLAAPFVAHMTSRMTKLEIRYFVIIGLAYQFALMLLANMGIPLGWTYMFGGFAFAFCLGPLVEKIVCDDRRFIVLEILSAVCLATTVFLVSRGWSANAFDLSPLYTILSAGIYLLLLRAGNKMQSNAFVTFAAKHSFSVYLIHMMVLLPVASALPKVWGPASIGMHILTTAIVFVVSLFISIVLDRIVIDPLKALFDRATRKKPRSRAISAPNDEAAETSR